MEIEPVSLTVTLRRRGSFVVAVPQENQPVMRAADVDGTIAELRNGPMEQETDGMTRAFSVTPV